VRTCVINDIRRYFPGQAIRVPDRVVEAVRWTYMDSIQQLVPEDDHLFSGIILAVPSLSFALRIADFLPEAMIDSRLSAAPTDAPSWGYAWTVSLSRMFFDDEGQATSIAKRVHEAREFGIFELIDGILGAMSRPWGHMIQSLFIQKLQKASARYANGDLEYSDLLHLISERSRLCQNIDPAFARQQLGLFLDNRGRLRVVPFAAWSLSAIADANDESQEFRLARGNVVQTADLLLRERLDEFEWLIEQDRPEHEFQRFLELNPYILTALGPYSRAVPHIILQQDDGSELIPDFFLELADRRGADILEIKLPGVRLDVRRRSRDRLTANVHAAVAQLRTYRDWFKSAAHRTRFAAATGMKSFLPRAVLVIGRSSDFQGHVDRLSFEETLPEWVTLRTYDDLVRSAREWKQITDQD
jgi:hypothetical protein